MSRSTGQHAEDFALAYLQTRNLRLITRNYHCPRGEIDLIMHSGKTLVFIEVRMRSNNRFGSPAETVNYRKQQKLIYTARHFLQYHPQYRNWACRFDILACDKTHGNNVSWITNAIES